MTNTQDPAGTVKINPGLWIAAITIVGAIVTMTGAILSRPTTEAVEKVVRSELAPVLKEMQYLKEDIQRIDGGSRDEPDPPLRPQKRDTEGSAGIEDASMWNMTRSEIALPEQMSRYLFKSGEF